MTRIGTAYTFQSAAAALLRNQAELATTQAQLASGKRVTRNGDDPVASAEIAARSASVDAHAAYSRNRDFLQGELRQLESMLGSAGDTLQLIRETLVQAGDPTLTDSDRNTLAATLDAYRAQLLSLANSQGSDGQYFFGGYDSLAPPFVASGGVVSFVSDSGARAVPVAPSLQIPVNADGNAVFGSIQGGNGVFATRVVNGNLGSGRIDTGAVVNPTQLTGHDYSLQLVAPGQIDVTDLSTNAVQSFAFVPGDAIVFDGMRVVIAGQPAQGDRFSVLPSASETVFAMIDRAAAALRTPVYSGTDRTRLADDVRRGIADIDQALDRALSARTDLGGRLGALDLAETVGTRAADEATAVLSSLTDIDYAEASTRYSAQQVARDAALAAYGRFAGSSLFDYLR